MFPRWPCPPHYGPYVEQIIKFDIGE